MKKKKSIALVITIWLVVIVLAACIVSAILTYLTLSKRSNQQTEALVKQNVEDVSNDIGEIVDKYILSYIDDLMTAGYNTAKISDEQAKELSSYLQEYYHDYPGIEINIVNSTGRIIVSSNPDPRYIGFDMYTNGEQAAEFVVLLDPRKDVDELVQDLKEKSLDGSQMKYAGISFPDGS